MKAIATAFAFVAVGGLIWLLSLVAGGGAKAEEGRIVLRYGRGFRAIGLMGVVAAFLAVAAFLVLLFVGEMSEGGLIGVTVLVAVFLIPSVPLVLEGYRREIVLDDEGISARGWFGPAGEFAWDEITKVEWLQMGEKYVVRAGKQKISLNGYLDGLGAFEQMCVAKLDPKVYGKTFAAATGEKSGGKKFDPAKPGAKPTKPAAGSNDNPFEFGEDAPPPPPKPAAPTKNLGPKKPKRPPVDDDE